MSIPGPSDYTRGMLIPGRFGAGVDKTIDFFSSMIPALRETPAGQTVLGATGNYGRAKSDWTLADMQEGVARIMVTNVEQLLNQAVGESWYYLVCPVRTGDNTLRYRINQTIFRPVLAQEAAPRTRPRQLDIEQKVGEQGLTRYITGFSVDGETLLGGVEHGIEWFAERVAMMQIGIIETDKFLIMSAIINSHRVSRGKWTDLTNVVRKMSDAQSWIRWRDRMAFSSAKERTPFEFWATQSDTDFRILGVPVDNIVTIVHTHTMEMQMNNEYYTNKSKGDHNDYLYDGVVAMQFVRGRPIFTTRNFIGRDEASVINPIGFTATFGVYYPLIDPHANRPDEPYKTSSRTARITDADNSAMMSVPILDAAAHSGRWDLLTGDLRSLVDPDAWAAANNDQRRKIGGQADNDACHIRIENTAFGGYYEDASYVGPAHFFGSLKEKTLPRSVLHSCALTVIANLAAGERKQFEDTIAEFVSLVEEAGKQKMFNATGGLINGDLFSTTYEYRALDKKGCRQTNPTLRFVARDSNTGFMTMNYKNTGDNAITYNVMPAGFGSLPAMRSLLNGARLGESLRGRIEKVVNGAEKIAAKLADAFGTSTFLDVDYAPVEMFDATPKDMLFTTALIAPRPVLLLMKSARKATGDELLVALFNSTTTYYASGTAAQKAVVAQFNPDTFKGNNYAAAMALTALRNFAKQADGTFIELPEKRSKDFSLDGSLARVKESIVAAMRSPIKGGYVSSSAELSRSFDDIIRASTSDDDLNDVAMTQLYLEPSQIVELRASNSKAYSIGSVNDLQTPATDDELGDYANAIVNGGNLPYFAAPLTMKHSLLAHGSVHSISTVAHIRRFMAANGYPVPRSSSTSKKQFGVGSQAFQFSSSNGNSNRRAQLLSGLKPAAVAALSLRSSAVDPSGAGRQFIGCVNANVDLMFNDEFVRRWAEVNMYSSSSLELMIQRLYMTSTTNFATIRQWAVHNVRIPLSFGLLRELRVRTNPIIRMLPGESTMFYARSFDRTLQGTDPGTGVFSIAHSYYSAPIIVNEKQIQVYHNVDAYGYIGGMGNKWADFQTGQPGMVSFLMPGTETPVAISPFGNIGFDANGYADVKEFDVGTQSIAMFESMRQNRTRKPWMPIHNPDNKYGFALDSAMHEYYSRDTVMFAGSDGSFKLHVPSAGLLPTAWATDDLVKILNGEALRVSNPLTLQSNDQLAAVSAERIGIAY